MKRRIGQYAAPAVKNHHRLRTGFDLCIQILSHRIGIDGQHFVHQIRPLVEHGFNQSVVVRACALDHVASQCPGAARKADQRHTPVERFADRRDRIKHIPQLGHVGHRQFGHGGFVAHHVSEFGAFAQGKAQTQTHRVGHGQNIAEQNGGIQLVALQRLQRHFSCVVGIGGQTHEAACFGTRGFVFRQGAAGRAHQPDRRVGGGLAHTRAQKSVVLKRCVHRVNCLRSDIAPGSVTLWGFSANAGQASQSRCMTHETCLNYNGAESGWNVTLCGMVRPVVNFQAAVLHHFQPG